MNHTYESNNIHGIAFTEQFESKFDKYEMIYIHAAFGWGKAAFMQQFLACREIRDYNWMSYGVTVSEPEEVLEKILCPKQSVLILERFEHLLTDVGIDRMMDILWKKPEGCKLVILSTLPVPDKMMPLAVRGHFVGISQKEWQPTQEEVEEYFSLRGLELKEYELLRIQNDFANMPLAILYLVIRLKEAGGSYTGSVREKCLEDLFVFVDIRFFRELPVEWQDLLVEMGIFSELTPKLVATLHGMEEAEASAFLQKVYQWGSMLDELEAGQRYRYQPFFEDYLFRVRRKYGVGEKKLDDIYRRGLQYCLSIGDYEQALKLSSILEEQQTTAEILNILFSTRLKIWDAWCLETIFSEMPLNLLLKYPLLVMAKAMVEASLDRPQEAGRLYGLLERLSTQAAEETTRRESAECLQYLYLCMPVMEPLRQPEYYPVDTDNTAMIPKGIHTSLWHGLKDHTCEPDKCPNRLKKIEENITLLFPENSSVYGKLFRGELLYEYDSIDEAMDELVKGVNLSWRMGEKELFFTGGAILCKALLCTDSREEIVPLIDRMEQKTKEVDSVTLTGNMQAFITELQLRIGSSRGVEKWMQEMAPQEEPEFNLQLYYQYVVKCRGYLWQKRYTKAYVILAHLWEFAQTYQMHHLSIQLLVLRAAAQFQEGKIFWRRDLKKAVKLAASYNYIRVIADECYQSIGMFQTLLGTQEGRQELKKEGCNPAFMERLWAAIEPMIRMAGAQEETAEKADNSVEPLTLAEKRVLKILVEGKKNEEIAKILCVSNNTVKYHLKNIFAKLEVSNRNQAARAAVEKNLLV